MSNGFGGLFVAVIVALWLIFLVPAWANRTHDKQQNRHTRREQKVTTEMRRPEISETRSRLDSLAERSFRLRRTSVFFSFLAVALVACGAFAATQALQNPWMFALAALALSLGAFSGLVARKSIQLNRQLLANSVRARGSISVESAKTKRNFSFAPSARQPRDTDRGWIPTPLPEPKIQPLVGEIQIPNFADVVELPNAKPNVRTASPNIDEIMRRRRANG